jgi:hypothetical protein
VRFAKRLILSLDCNQLRVKICRNGTEFWQASCCLFLFSLFLLDGAYHGQAKKVTAKQKAYAAHFALQEVPPCRKARPLRKIIVVVMWQQHLFNSSWEVIDSKRKERLRLFVNLEPITDSRLNYVLPILFH